jgi:hypothetical protein
MTSQHSSTLSGHQGRILAIVWNPDGHTFVSSSVDGTVRLWDAVTGICLKVLKTDRPYEGMNILDVKGLTDAQKVALQILGAIQQPVDNDFRNRQAQAIQIELDPVKLAQPVAEITGDEYFQPLQAEIKPLRFPDLEKD